MRQNQVEKLRSDSIHLLPSLELIEHQIQALDDDSNTDKELRHLARLLYAGQLSEPIYSIPSTNKLFVNSSLTTNTPCKSFFLNFLSIGDIS